MLVYCLQSLFQTEKHGHMYTNYGHTQISVKQIFSYKQLSLVFFICSYIFYYIEMGRVLQITQKLKCNHTAMVHNSSLKTFPLGHSMLENNNKRWKLFPRWSCMRTDTLPLCFSFTVTIIPHSQHLEHRACVVLPHTKQSSAVWL